MDKMAASIDKGLSLIKLIMEKMEISNEEEYDDPDMPIDMSSKPMREAVVAHNALSKWKSKKSKKK